MVVVFERRKSSGAYMQLSKAKRVIFWKFKKKKNGELDGTVAQVKKTGDGQSWKIENGNWMMNWRSINTKSKELIVGRMANCWFSKSMANSRQWKKKKFKLKIHMESLIVFVPSSSSSCSSPFHIFQQFEQLAIVVPPQLWISAQPFFNLKQTRCIACPHGESRNGDGREWIRFCLLSSAIKGAQICTSKRDLNWIGREDCEKSESLTQNSVVLSLEIHHIIA